MSIMTGSEILLDLRILVHLFFLGRHVLRLRQGFPEKEVYQISSDLAKFMSGH